MKLENLKNLESLLVGLSALDFKTSTEIKIDNCLKDVKEAINVIQCCKSDSELLHTEVFKLANKLAINGYGNEAVKMHRICNGM